MRRLLPGLAALGLLAASCVVAPMACHDGLPASMPAPGFAAARFEYNRAYWRHDSISAEPFEYISGGLRFGQEWRRFCFEEGLTVLNPGVILPCLEGGVGLREPAVALRALWTPVTLGSQFGFDPMLWWQVSALAGTPRKSRGFGISGGAQLRTCETSLGTTMMTEDRLQRKDE